MKFNLIIEQLDELIQSHSLTTNPDCNPDITQLAPLDEALSGHLSFIEGDKFASMIAKTNASALILPLNETLQTQATQQGIAWIATANPRLLFAHTIRLFYQPFRPSPGIHPTAVIDPDAQLGENVSIGANVVIQAGVKLGNEVCIHPNVVIYPGVTLGDRTILHGNCTIHERTVIGADCVIHSGAVIGSEGFGFVPTAEGWFKTEQSGITVLEDGVEVGCNSTIDRPAVGETRVKRNTKIDNLTHIAHGCQIGENCAFAAQVGLAGGVKVGNRVILAGQVGVANQAKIGDGAIASAQTGIPNDVAAGEIVSGSPCVPNKLYLKVSAIYKRLPEMYQALKQIQKQLEKNS
ncbi:UDP-3-O-(3-hydroxymyristoyl) glucosamine N-acyltransferase [Gloeothece citriformis PCC 7424]|uniref:UDP-3-O-acylglucosamine N-acyltransferase n=1 Tax=Gloeothece citriformis (strain PCC 7424) TaxID=65393 RepID=LPXD_GLOC7|nr:UDP-3-O-(3-hydroxymyristoyl)glucosamine N-acyltransferase [Gloeothece citriformis]B7KFG9.1 RecName: Full=UDP-3-O-acylglucosamine N-acyltransferase [Gloeothece citriformis PCC 7424]ACK71885.1 UDP-3-O-(3-hydroxymyristoyl) glucosamine N-acyltransferase [Gloeothece citriformis PCC 7424]